jgi:hypothetical protein
MVPSFAFTKRQGNGCAVNEISAENVSEDRGTAMDVRKKTEKLLPLLQSTKDIY